LIATYQWQSQAPDVWDSLKRYRFELLLAVTAIAVGMLIWLHLTRATPTAADVEQSLQTYVQALRSSRSLTGGSLRMEMQADVLGPRVTRLDVNKTQQFMDYWTIDAVMQVEKLGNLPVDVPIRLRVARQDGAWMVVDAEDLARHAPLRQ
jgi:hypothetical protein